MAVGCAPRPWSTAASRHSSSPNAATSSRGGDRLDPWRSFHLTVATSACRSSSFIGCALVRLWLLSLCAQEPIGRCSSRLRRPKGRPTDEPANAEYSCRTPPDLPLQGAKALSRDRSQPAFCHIITHSLQDADVSYQTRQIDIARGYPGYPRPLRPRLDRRKAGRRPGAAIEPVGLRIPAPPLQWPAHLCIPIVSYPSSDIVRLALLSSRLAVFCYLCRSDLRSLDDWLAERASQTSRAFSKASAIINFLILPSAYRTHSFLFLGLKTY